MIRRPNIRAGCFQNNLHSRHSGNRHYFPRGFKLYLYGRMCRWCHRRFYFNDIDRYPKLCFGCGLYLINLERSAEINYTSEYDDYIPF